MAQRRHSGSDSCCRRRILNESEPVFATEAHTGRLELSRLRKQPQSAQSGGAEKTTTRSAVRMKVMRHRDLRQQSCGTLLHDRKSLNPGGLDACGGSRSRTRPIDRLCDFVHVFRRQPRRRRGAPSHQMRELSRAAGLFGRKAAPGRPMRRCSGERPYIPRRSVSRGDLPPQSPQNEAMKHQSQRDGEGRRHHQRIGRDEQIRLTEGQEMLQARSGQRPMVIATARSAIPKILQA
jgi:hypothetical protein